jgi:hypothetical protein
MAARAGESNQDVNAGIKRAIAVDYSGGDVSLVSITRGVYLGTAGNLAVVFADQPDSASVILTNLAAGIWHPMQIQKVLQTGSTASLGVFAGY